MNLNPVAINTLFDKLVSEVPYEQRAAFLSNTIGLAIGMTLPIRGALDVLDSATDRIQNTQAEFRVLFGEICSELLYKINEIRPVEIDAITRIAAKVFETRVLMTRTTDPLVILDPDRWMSYHIGGMFGDAKPTPNSVMHIISMIESLRG